RRDEPRCRGRRRRAGPSPRPLSAPMVRRHQLHDHRRRDPRATRAVDGHLDQAPCGLARVGGPLSGTATVGEVSADDPTPSSDDTPDPTDEDLGEVRDELPEDLDVSGFVGPYVFPNNNRRRVPGYLYIFFGLVCVVLWTITRGGDPVLVNF